MGRCVEFVDKKSILACVCNLMESSVVHFHFPNHGTVEVEHPPQETRKCQTMPKDTYGYFSVITWRVLNCMRNDCVQEIIDFSIWSWMIN